MESTSLPQLMELLKGVSRSFFLSIRILQKPLREPIGVAYLLARISDTIADTTIIPPEERILALLEFKESIHDSKKDLKLDSWNKCHGAVENNNELELLEKCSEVLAYYHNMTVRDKDEVLRVVDVIIGGQVLDLERFDKEPKKIRSLNSPEELDDYTYRVAGIVGSFWTRICHLKGVFKDLDLEEDGIAFGKGLQLVNILRDLPGDLKYNRCYLPQSQLDLLGLKSSDLLMPDNWQILKPLYLDWVSRSESYLVSGWKYVKGIPRKRKLMQLACAWPALIGLETLSNLKNTNPLENEKIKVSRGWVYKLMLKSLLVILFTGQLNALPGWVLSDKKIANKLKD